MMEHNIIYKQKREYCSFPLIRNHYKDNFQVCFFKSLIGIDHIGEKSQWVVMKTKDQGKNWENDPLDIKTRSLFSPREISDSYWSNEEIIFGAKSWREISPEHKKNILKRNEPLIFMQGKKLMLLENSLFWIKKYFITNKNLSKTKLRTTIPDVNGFLLFPRHIDIDSPFSPKTSLLSGYSVNKYLNKPFVIQLDRTNPSRYDLIDMFHGQINASEMAFIELQKGIIYATIRSESSPFLLDSYSYDYGRTWTYPKNLIVGHPPHLLKLKDGRILCTFGFRQKKVGINAIVSRAIEKNKIIWDKNIITIRDGAGHPSEFTPRLKRKKDNGLMHVGYPVSIQLEDGSIFTVYYITKEDGITHIASTRWEVATAYKNPTISTEIG